MANEGLRNVFGVAITAANIRIYKLGYSGLQSQLCNAFGSAFGLSNTDSGAIYNHIRNSSLFTSNGFDQTSHYKFYEDTVYAILDSFINSESLQNKQILAVSAHAVIFGYYLNSNVTITQLYKVIGNVLSSVASNVNNSQPFFTEKDGTVIHPFTPDVIKTLVSKDYSLAINEINSSPKDREVTLANYNWYDMSSVFSSPNLQLMKDIENQYYYISGQLNYSGSVSQLSDCIEDTITINTFEGTKVTTFIRNTPCIEAGSYIGPNSGSKFYRVFNDGPSSSGHLTSAVRDAYINFDKAVLSGNDYSSNAITIYSFLKDSHGNYAPVYDGPVFEDANGQYSLSGAEYPYLFTNCDLSGTRMHIGDNFPRVICDNPIICTTCHTHDYTGFKFVSLELDPKLYLNTYLGMQTNPVLDTGRALKRGLNIAQNPFIATNVGDELQTFTTQAGNDIWYVGPPQLNGANQLPTLAFYQTFDSVTFGDKAQVVLYPCIGTADGSIGSESSRSFSISPIPLTTGRDNSHHFFNDTEQPRATFLQTVTSSQIVDDIYRQFFGMGDNFSGQYTNISFSQENAGFVYNNYILSGSGGILSADEAFNTYSGFILGSPVKNIRYISGYQNGSEFIQMNRLYGQDGTGNLKLYYYFDERNMPHGEPVKTTGMSFFAEPPAYLESHYSRVYTTQQVENYLPRFYKGPFAIEKEKFLYPNAIAADKFYVGKQNGFPARIRFTLELREETVKELFGTYKISKDGIIDSTPTYTRVIRSSESGANDLKIAPYMRRIFYPDDPQYNFTYDFNNFAIGDDFSTAGSLVAVDNNWAPLWHGFVTSGRNNVTYNSIYDTNFIFTQGIRMTGFTAQQHKTYTGTGINDFKLTASQKPLDIGLYHGYKTMSVDVELFYTLPIFNIDQHAQVVTDEITGAYRPVADNVGVPVEGYYDERFNINTGMDPLFFETVGGRLGGLNPTGDGGYHSKGFIGDRWNGTVAATYGIGQLHDTSCHRGDIYRAPQNDDRILMFNTTLTGTEIWTKSLAFAPFAVDRNYKSFNAPQILNWSMDGHTGKISTVLSGEYLNFAVDTLMPPKNGIYGQFYSVTGLVIGPFDREVEIVVIKGNSVIAYTDLYANGNKVSQLYFPNSCSYDALKGQAQDSGVMTNGMGRSDGATVVTVVRSGGYLNLNVLSSPVTGGDGSIPAGFIAETMVGIQSGSRLSVRNRKLLDGSVYTPELHSGEIAWLSPFYFVQNGFERRYQIPQSSFADLVGTHEFVSFSQSGKIYPTPADDFTGLGTVDSLGNIKYPPSATVEQYWKNFAKDNFQNVLITGYREGSRISFNIKNMKILYDVIPYQDYKIVVPSGTCIVSGEMGYKTQADRAIFSEGIYLVNNTENDVLKELYNPSFVSTILSRLPWFVIPSGTTHGPVYEAPSVMKQREFQIITGTQSYSGLLSSPPDNYNKLNWPALSDLETLNAGETIEAIPPDDGNTFTDSTMIFSAAQGQTLANGNKNPNIRKIYDVAAQYQMYDSIATDAILNSGVCITSGRGTVVRITPALMQSLVVPAETSLSLAVHGLK